jgi:hypothetical protein
MSAHTNGPWRILSEEVDRSYIRVRGTVPGGRYKIANVPTVAYEGVPEWEAEETRANARLIASAPELLEALDLLLHDRTPWTVSCARAAIAKARGEQP